MYRTFGIAETYEFLEELPGPRPAWPPTLEREKKGTLFNELVLLECIRLNYCCNVLDENEKEKNNGKARKILERAVLVPHSIDDW